MRELSLYFHIPYCKSKCHYCDFNSFDNKSGTIDEYFKSMLKEIEMNKEIHRFHVKTIFFGGGTPSYINPSYIADILDKCTEYFEIDKDCEITIEGNPESLTKNNLIDYKNMGINRLSIGLQAWQNRLLSKIGRIHSKEQFVTAFINARKIGFKNINVDLMFSLPNQSMKDWHQTLESIMKLEPEHISCYSLKLEEGTKMYYQCENNLIQLPDEDTDREMYYLAQNTFEKNGYKQYEISNFAKPKFECRHNIAYWTYVEYAGFGAGAHSFIDYHRIENISDIHEYINAISNNKLPHVSKESLHQEEQMSEYIITGLRLTKGIDKRKFSEKFGVEVDKLYGDVVEKLAWEGLLANNKNHLKLTAKGLDLGNVVMREFI